MFKIPPREPFNLKPLKVKDETLQYLQEIKTIDIFESPSSKNFHDEGLYSTLTFGSVGSKERYSRFGYINIKADILHPMAFKNIERLKSFYVDIMTNKAYATWDAKTGSFLPADSKTGKTGYSYFMSKWKDLKFVKNESENRNIRIDMINKYRDDLYFNKILVLPAGYRDVDITDDGKTEEHELGAFYKKFITLSRNIDDNFANDEIYDKVRLGIQQNFNDLFDYFENILGGKYGRFNKSYAQRRMAFGTRNVISSLDPSVEDIDSKYNLNVNSLVIGLWELSVASMPLTIHKLKNNILSKVFLNDDSGALLVNKKTLKSEIVQLTSKDYDRWTTTEGLEKVVLSQHNLHLRNLPVEIADHYLALIYIPKKLPVFKIFSSIDELPDDIDKSDVYPITLEEMIYLCNFRDWNRNKVISTRYPIEKENSLIPCNAFLQTTIEDTMRVELDDLWTLPVDIESNLALTFPSRDDPHYIDTIKISPFRIGGQGGDYDGDLENANVPWTKEATDQIDKLMKSRNYILDARGEFRASCANDTTDLIMHVLTKEPKYA